MLFILPDLAQGLCKQAQGVETLAMRDLGRSKQDDLGFSEALLNQLGGGVLQQGGVSILLEA